MPKAKRGTYRVTYGNGDVMIHGNNYKPWWMHAIEYTKRNDLWSSRSKHQLIKSVEYSDTIFVDDGGLKWCPASEYQDVIDEVAAKDGKVLWPYTSYVFENSTADLVKIDKEIEKW